VAGGVRELILQRFAEQLFALGQCQSSARNSLNKHAVYLIPYGSQPADETTCLDRISCAQRNAYRATTLVGGSEAAAKMISGAFSRQIGRIAHNY